MLTLDSALDTSNIDAKKNYLLKLLEKTSKSVKVHKTLLQQLYYFLKHKTAFIISIS